MKSFWWRDNTASSLTVKEWSWLVFQLQSSGHFIKIYRRDYCFRFEWQHRQSSPHIQGVAWLPQQECIQQIIPAYMHTKCRGYCLSWQMSVWPLSQPGYNPSQLSSGDHVTKSEPRSTRLSPPEAVNAHRGI